MSAANYYQPHVYLDGVLLDEHAGSAGLVAVADFTIKWGEKDWWSNIDPAKLDLTLLDPQGALLGHATNQTIEIRRDPDDRIVFRGTIDNITSSYGETTDPSTGDRRDMWTHRIAAQDPTAQLARDRRRGPTYDERDIAPYRLHWGPCYMSERKADLATRSPISIMFDSSLLDQYDGATPILIFPVPAYERQQVVSTLTVLRNTARISHPLNRPIYLPSEHLIRFVAPMGAAPGLGNHLEAGKIVLGLETDFGSDTAEAVVLPGSQLSIEGGIAAGSALREQVNRVEMTGRATRPNTFVVTPGEQRYMENVENSTAFTVPGTDGDPQMTVQLESDYSSGFWYEEMVTSFTTLIRAALAPTYGAPTFEPFTYQFEKHAPAPAWALPWLIAGPTLTTLHRPVVYHLIESLTNWVPGVLPFSVVGGVIKYTHRRGWQVSLNPAPRALWRDWLPDDYPTLGDLDTGADATLANVGDNTFIADWQTLNLAN